MKTALQNSIPSFFSSLGLLVFLSLNIQAQDYLVTFTGAGASTDVTTVKVENLTQAKQLEINGTDILHLKAVLTDIETINNSKSGKIDIYPNPMKDNARMEFDLSEPGETMITIYDLSGRKIAQKQDLLSNGRHTYGLHGVEQGMYFIKVSSSRFDFRARLISSGSGSSGIIIEYENTLDLQEKQTALKGAEAEVIMQYNTGDILKMTGISGNYSTVVTDVPTAGKTIIFNFIACTDGDGNHYPVLQITTAKGQPDNSDQGSDKGLLIWMAENLKTAKYNDGIGIPNVTSNGVWGGLSTPAYCWYGNNFANKDIYGALYNWHAVNSGKLCPSGWHVPNDGEWTVLTNYFGGELAAGQKLKETGTSHWLSLNPATNESGFTARPGGNRYRTADCSDMNMYGYWWTSSGNSSTSAWYRRLYHYVVSIHRSDDNKVNGYSVRCVRD